MAERAIELVPRAKLRALVGDFVRLDDIGELLGRQRCDTVRSRLELASKAREDQSLDLTVPRREERLIPSRQGGE
jgi:hypothetical protein